MWFLIKTLLLFLILAQISYAKVIILFNEDGTYSPKYNSLISPKNLKTGDRVKFSNKKEFEIIKHLGSGNVTTIFLVKKIDSDDKVYALRLPKSISTNVRRSHLLDTKLFLNSMIDGSKELEIKKIPIPKIYEYIKDQYMLVEYIEHDFNLLQFLTKPKSIAPEILDPAEKALITFAKNSAQFREIADFRAEQMVYNIKENKWYLIDWGKYHYSYYKSSLNEMLFDDWFFKQLGFIRNKDNNPIKFPGIDYFFKRKLSLRELRIKNEIQAAINSSRSCLERLFLFTTKNSIH